MNPVVKEAWVLALTSGEFTQGQSALHRDDGSMCCMGVLCELYRRAYPDTSRWREDSYTADRQMFVVDGRGGSVGETNYPPRAVWDWAGIPVPLAPGGGLKEPVLLTGATRRVKERLSIINDRGENFLTIAGLIKEYL